MIHNPIRPFLDYQSTLVLDGGLATHLETLGCDLRDELWSARLLIENPAIIRQAHLDYFWAGADCAISASYQASIPGLMKRGLSKVEATELLRLSVTLAIEARAAFWKAAANRKNRLRPIVAASIGPYGAFLADGSEYSGDYGLSEDDLLAWHRSRWHVLASTEADLLACETLPSYLEAHALLRLLDETPQTAVYFSFSCQDGSRLNDGTLLETAVSHIASHPQVVAIGINCTAPQYISSLIKITQENTKKPIIIYPNSGEAYDAANNRWLGQSDPSQFGTFSREWRKMGAALIGGCCRTTPDHIRQIRDRVRYRKL